MRYEQQGHKYGTVGWMGGKVCMSLARQEVKMEWQGAADGGKGVIGQWAFKVHSQ